MVAVRVLENVTVYHPQTCSLVKIHRGQVVEGDQAVFLLASAGRSVESLDPPQAAEPDLAAVDRGAPEMVSENPLGPVGEPEATEFDPSQHSGAAVIAYAKAHPEQAAAIRAWEDDPERGGKQRTTVLSSLSTN